MAATDGISLQPGQNCWRIEQADHFAFIRDAADYFVTARKAMMAARRSILLIGWDFDARIALGQGDDGGPPALGDFILWLAERSPELEIRLLRWDTGAFKAMFRGNTLWHVLKWKLHPRITLTLDRHHPFASSHHQKIVVIDDSLAFCGGIDMTAGRWDRPSHLDDDPLRLGPDGRPHGPWHDATSAFDGAAARAIAELARDRWQLATGQTLPAPDPCPGCWPADLAPTFTDLPLAIARSQPKMPDTAPVHEIEQAYIDMIAGARRMIYVESQYFASRRIGRAIAERLAAPDGPEVVVVNPVTTEGWLEPLAMDTARARLVEALRGIDHQGRLRVYCPVTAGGTPIFVHAKVMVVDDRVLRVGSSNINNRSLRLDTECDVILSADLPGCAHLETGIADLRNRLLAEHLDVTPDRVATRLAETGSLIACIEGLRGPGRSLRPYQVPQLSGLEEWLAENEILDPNGPEEIFESPARRGLFKGWDRIRKRVHDCRQRRA